MFHDADPLNFLVTVDTGDHDVRAGCLMQVDFFSQALCFTFVEGLAFDGLKVTEIIMSLHLCVTERHWAAQIFVFALELHLVQLLLNLFLDRNEARLFALHGTLACLLGKLVQADLVEALLAFFALPWLS